MFILNLRKGVTVVGLLLALLIPWLIENGPDLWANARHGLETVHVPAAMQGCESHADCAYVEISCSSCCHYEAIAADSLPHFYAEVFKPACGAYSGAVCDCAPAQVKPICVDGHCRLDTPPPTYND